MTSPEATRLVLNGWRDNETLLVVTASLFCFSATSKCRVFEVTEDSLVLDSVDGETRFSVNIVDPDLRFIYSEPRERLRDEVLEGLTGDERIASAISIAFPLRVRVSSPTDVPSVCEKMFLMEVPA